MSHAQARAARMAMAAAPASQRGETLGKAPGDWRRSSMALSKAEGDRFADFECAGVRRGVVGFGLGMIWFYFMVARGVVLVCVAGEFEDSFMGKDETDVSSLLPSFARSPCYPGRSPGLG